MRSRIDLGTRHVPRFIVAASGCAPPMPPRPAVTTSRPVERAAEVLAVAAREGLVRALQDALACRCRSTSRPSSGRTSSGPFLELAEVLPRRPVRPTRLRVGDQHARRVGACVRKTPTGLPDCTSSVSSGSSRWSVAHDGVEASQLRAAWPRPAVDDELLGDPRRPRGRGCSGGPGLARAGVAARGSLRAGGDVGGEGGVLGAYGRHCWILWDS